MSYDLVKSIRDLMQKGIGDTARLKYILDRLENGKYLFLSDQKYLEKLLISKEEEGYVEVEGPKSEQNNLQKLEANLKILNNQLERAVRLKQKDEELTPEELIPDTRIPDTRRPSEIKLFVEDQKFIEEPQKPERLKSENLTLVLSIVLGIISLQGIGHIYIGKLARGIGILVLSMLISVIGFSYFIGIIPQNYLPPTMVSFFTPILILGYLGLYIFQILDGNKLCLMYNRYVSEHGNNPPWW